ncbi:MAG: cation-transporting P-type ATPase [Marinobacter sp.]|uniref:cation-transporting P-type ATPase n=1 Tax=Marinobacter sp. TaxID=50741 RepID=UPI00396EBD60
MARNKARKQGNDPSPQPSWHALARDELLSQFATDGEGLSEEESRQRLAEYGPNALPEVRPRGVLVRFFSHFRNLLIYVLVVAAAIAAALHHWVDTAVILTVVLVNATIGFIQEGKAEDALRAIRQLLSAKAMVVRGGRRMSVPAEQLVPGDLVTLQSGDKVPADLRLLKVKGLQVQEAALTGESVAVSKSLDPIRPDADLGDRRNMAYSGTLVTQGQGAGIVVATGVDTEIGRISTMVSRVESLTTPLLQQMDRLARWITAAVLLIATLVFVAGITLRDHTAVEMFMIVVGLAVAAIPEGLPAILTVTLAIGVQRMATRKAIIRRLPVVETLGSVSVIGSDKTGTLTRNEMTVRSVVTVADSYTVTGTGYDPHGTFERDGQASEPTSNDLLRQTLLAALLCNDSSLQKREDNNGWEVHGDPMEGALLVAAMKAGMNPEHETKQYPRADLIPFESEHKFMATLHHSHEGRAFLFLKGAPERVVEMCKEVVGADHNQPMDREYWHEQIEQMAARGQRVLAVATKPAPNDQSELTFDDVENGLALLGLYGLIDPPREEAISAVGECQAAGIRVKMITGDHSSTARAIAAQLKLQNTAEAVTGHELERMDDAELQKRLSEVDVYARVSPEHKLRIVTLLQQQGAIVAMTGDGVNDAPALKRADVGIAMGHKGTEAAKEAAEMVISDDNFASIVDAVREGRTVYDNLKKAIAFLLPVNGGESVSIILAILAGLTLPIAPLQILWVNMVSSVALAMALAFEVSENDIMKRPPRPAKESMLTSFLVWRILLVSTLFAAGIFGIFSWTQYHGYTLEESRTYAVNTLVIMEIFYLFSVRRLRSTSLGFTGLFGSGKVLIAVGVVLMLQLVFTYAPFMETFFDTRPIPAAMWFVILAVGLGLLMVLELEKWLIGRWSRRDVRSRRD